MARFYAQRAENFSSFISPVLFESLTLPFYDRTFVSVVFPFMDPDHLQMGFSRSAWSRDKFHEVLNRSLAGIDDQLLPKFISRCDYHAGQVGLDFDAD